MKDSLAPEPRFLQNFLDGFCWVQFVEHCSMFDIRSGGCCRFAVFSIGCWK